MSECANELTGSGLCNNLQDKWTVRNGTVERGVRVRRCPQHPSLRLGLAEGLQGHCPQDSLGIVKAFKVQWILRKKERLPKTSLTFVNPLLASLTTLMCY